MDKNQSGMSIIELVVATGILVFIVYTGSQVYVMQSQSSKANEISRRILDLKSHISSNIDCEATFSNYTGSCDGSDFVQLYQRTNNGVEVMTPALESAGSLVGSGSLKGFYVRAICQNDQILMDAAIARKNPSGTVAFQKDPLDLIKNATTPRVFDFDHPRTAGFISESDALCIQNPPPPATGGFSRFTMYTGSGYLWASRDIGNIPRETLAKYPDDGSYYKTKGEKLYVSFETYIVTAGSGMKWAAERTRYENAKLNLYLLVRASDGTVYYNNQIATFDGTHASYFHNVHMGRMIDVDPGKDVTFQVDMDIVGYTSNTPPAIVDTYKESYFQYRGAGMVFYIEDYEK